MMDIQELHKWHDTFFPGNELFEVRLLGENGGARKVTVSGYFKDIDVLISRLSPLLEGNYQNYNFQAYFALNKLDDALYSRQQHDKFVWGALTTKDENITRRKWVFIDFDSKRPKGVSANEEEVQAAKKKLADVYKFLKSEGFHEPIMAFSGNGWHIHLKVDMPNDNEHKDLVKSFIDIIAMKYSDDKVDIDKSVFNIGRICKLYGTEARKGISTSERPWRLSKIEYIPEKIELNEDSLFQAFVKKYTPKKEDQEIRNTKSAINYGHFDLERWFNDFGVEYRYAGIENGMKKYQLRHCGWEDSHSSICEWKDAAIFVMPDGKIIYKCFHDHCADRTWPEFRKLHEPDYDPNKRDKYLQQGQTIIIQQQPQKKEKKPEIKQENSEDGPMWYELDEIPDIDLDSLEKIKTGITALDEKIMGLYLSEVTILSGSNSSGKSSFLNTLLLNAVDEGYKCALWSGELRADILKAWIDMVAAGKQHLTPSTKNIGKYYVSKDIKDKINRWLHGKLILFNNNYGAKWEQIFSQMEKKQAEGFKLFVLDNLMKMDIDILGDRTNEQQKKMIEKLGDFAKKNQVHIILVAHPRKSSGRGLNSFLRKDDIAGSSDIANLADNIFIIHRNNNDFRKGIAEYYGEDIAQQYRTEDIIDKKGERQPRGAKWNVGNVIEICKDRLYGEVDCLIDLYYEVESRRFKNYPTETKEYNWNENAKAKEETLNLTNNNSTNNNAVPFTQITDEAPF